MMKTGLFIVFLMVSLGTTAQRGKLSTEFHYKDLKSAEGKLDENGNRTGEWKFWDTQGRLCEIRTFKNGLLEGTTKVEKLYFAPDKSMVAKLESDAAAYEAALKRQKSSKLDTLIEKTDYVKNRKHGKKYYYYKDVVPNAVSEEVNYVNGAMNGKTSHYTKEGKLGSELYLTDDRMDSLISFNFEEYEKRVVVFGKEEKIERRYKSGKLVEVHFKDLYGKDTPRISCFYENGKLKSCDTLIKQPKETYFINNEDEDVEVVEIVIPPANEKVEVDEIFEVVEEPAEFPGGNQAMYDFIEKNFKLDTSIHGLKGKVFVTFVVDKEGYILDPTIRRGLSKEADAEALRVVGLMPQWKPGKQRGIAVKTRFTLPIIINQP